MATKQKRSFVFNIAWAEVLSDYPVEVRLEVYDAIIRYVASGTLPELKPLANMAFSFIKKDIDYNNSRYEETVAKRSEAGKKGMSSRYGKKEEPSGLTNVTSDNKNNTSYQDVTKLTNVTDNVDDNVDDDVDDNNTPPSNPPDGGGEDLEELSKKQKELEAKEAELRAKEQELLKLEAALKARKHAELPKIDFVSPEYAEAFTTWLEYKRERRESYKSDKSLRMAYSKLLQLSGNDPFKANAIVQQSMANNWAGLFELKQTSYGQRTDNNQARRESRKILNDLAAEILAADAAKDGF